MSKKRPKKSKFKIPGESKRRKRKRQEEVDLLFPFENFDKLSLEDLNKLDRLNTFYITAIRNFYNSIADENQKAPSDAVLFGLGKTLVTSENFSMDTIINDILFHFLTDDDKEDSREMILFLLESINYDLNQFKNNYHIQDLLSVIEEAGYTPLENKVLCLVQNTPTAYFRNRDEIIIDKNNEEFQQWAGDSYGPEILARLKQNLNMDSIKIKVINKRNNPKAYKNYLRLKQVMQKVEELDESAS